jgi:hypothetical protein
LAPPVSKPSETLFDDSDGAPRIGSIRFRTWIWSETNRSKDRLAIGALRVGTSVRLKSREPVAGSGCKGQWFAIEPFGFICTDDTTTLDLDTPYWRALAALRPKRGPWPYRYAFSTGAPMYSRIPTRGEQEAAERTFGPRSTFRPLGKWSESHEQLVSTREEDTFEIDTQPDFIVGTSPIAGSPWNPANPKVKVIPAGSGFGYARAFEAEGRTWLLTPDLFLVPADRAFPYRQSAFQGVTLDAGRTLPMAWVRADAGAPKLIERDGAFITTGRTWSPKEPLFLSGETRSIGKRTLHRVKSELNETAWVEDDDNVSVATAAKELKHGIRADERWIEASILNGTMIAYEGLTPRYATLWSPGKGGIPVKGNDPKKFATTEVGIFPIQWKDKVETMSPDPGAPTVFWFQDVPHIQYVHAPMAMHVAFWHDGFGYPMSAECLNVSAADGAWLFDFTLPALPRDWGSVGTSKMTGAATRINITP